MPSISHMKLLTRVLQHAEDRVHTTLTGYINSHLRLHDDPDLLDERVRIAGDGGSHLGTLGKHLPQESDAVLNYHGGQRNGEGKASAAAL